MTKKQEEEVKEVIVMIQILVFGDGVTKTEIMMLIATTKMEMAQ